MLRQGRRVGKSLVSGRFLQMKGAFLDHVCSHEIRARLLAAACPLFFLLDQTTWNVLAGEPPCLSSRTCLGKDSRNLRELHRMVPDELLASLTTQPGQKADHGLFAPG